MVDMFGKIIEEKSKSVSKIMGDQGGEEWVHWFVERQCGLLPVAAHAEVDGEKFIMRTASDFVDFMDDVFEPTGEVEDIDLHDVVTRVYSEWKTSNNYRKYKIDLTEDQVLKFANRLYRNKHEWEDYSGKHLNLFFLQWLSTTHKPAGGDGSVINVLSNLVVNIMRHNGEIV